MAEVEVKKRRARPKLGGGKRKNRSNRREQRRGEALVRQAVYDALTLDEKLAKARPGSREHLRLSSAKQ